MSFRRANALRSFGLNPGEVQPDSTSQDTFPNVMIPVQAAPTAREKESATRFLLFRDTIRNGPFFVGSLDNIKQNIRKLNSNITYEDLFKKRKNQRSFIKQLKNLECVEDLYADGISRYSDRYRVKKKIIRTVDDHPYHVDFFPRELHEVMGVNDKVGKKLKIEQNDVVVDLQEKLDEKIAETGENEVEEEEEEDLDEEFEEDEDDDYNAEKYFDGGEDDDYDDDGDGEADF